MSARLLDRRRGFRRAAAAALCALGCAGTLQAQLSDPRLGAGFKLETYTFGEAESVGIDQVQLLTIPVSARALIGSSFELGVSGAFARGTVTRVSGQESELSGLVDTELRLTARLLDDRFRLGVVALLPTGTSELDATQLDVAGLIAADVLPFAISNWGTGGGIGMNAAVAIPLARGTALGLSAGYVRAQEYEPLAGREFNYRPGNQLHVRAAFDHVLSRASKIALAISYQQFGTDQSDGSNIYQAGNRLQAVGSLAFPAGMRGSGIVYAGILRRLEGEYTNELLPITPTEDLLYTGATLRQPLGGLVLVPSVELRVVGNDDGVDQGYTLTAGTGAELAFGSVELVPSARVRFGNLTVRENQESGYTGLELGMMLRNRALTR